MMVMISVWEFFIDIGNTQQRKSVIQYQVKTEGKHINYFHLCTCTSHEPFLATPRVKQIKGK